MDEVTEATVRRWTKTISIGWALVFALNFVVSMTFRSDVASEGMVAGLLHYLTAAPPLIAAVALLIRARNGFGSFERSLKLLMIANVLVYMLFFLFTGLVWVLFSPHF